MGKCRSFGVTPSSPTRFAMVNSPKDNEWCRIRRSLDPVYRRLRLTTERTSRLRKRARMCPECRMVRDMAMAPGDPVMCPIHAQEREDLIRWSKAYGDEAFVKARPDATIDEITADSLRREKVHQPNQALKTRAANELRKSRPVQPDRPLHPILQKAEKEMGWLELRRWLRRSKASSPKSRKRR